MWRTSSTPATATSTTTRNPLSANCATGESRRRRIVLAAWATSVAIALDLGRIRPRSGGKVDPSGRTVNGMTRLPLATLLVGAAGLLAACGGASTTAASYSAPASAPAPSAGHVTTLRLTADPHGALRFNTSHLTAKAGRVKLVLTNPSSSGMPHGIAV